MNFWASQDVEVGDRFRRRGMSHKVYVIERFIEHNNLPRHACLVCTENSETLTIALSALLDARLFERIEV